MVDTGFGCFLGAADFFLAVFLLADFLVGFFLAADCREADLRTLGFFSALRTTFFFLLFLLAAFFRPLALLALAIRISRSRNASGAQLAR